MTGRLRLDLMNLSDTQEDEMVATRHVSEVRGLLAAREGASQREAARLLLESRGQPQWADLWRYAVGCDPDVLSPSRLVGWSEYDGCENHWPRESLAWMGESAWELRVCGVVLATHETPGVEEALRRWATRPGWYALDLWEASRFARSPEGAEHREAPRRCLEVVDAYRRGEATREQLAQARAAASYASYAAVAYDYAAHAARAAAYAAHAHAAAYAHTAAYAAERQRWHEDWTWHLLWHASRGWA